MWKCVSSYFLPASLSASAQPLRRIKYRAFVQDTWEGFQISDRKHPGTFHTAAACFSTMLTSILKHSRATFGVKKNQNPNTWTCLKSNLHKKSVGCVVPVVWGDYLVIEIAADYRLLPLINKLFLPQQLCCLPLLSFIQTQVKHWALYIVV